MIPEALIFALFAIPASIARLAPSSVGSMSCTG